MQADIDSAFRRVPISDAHRWACGVVFIHKGKVRRPLYKFGVVLPRFVRGLDMHVEVYFAQHIGCPFGAVASVHAWERVGAAVCHIARVYLKIPVRLIWSAFVSPLSERF